MNLVDKILKEAEITNPMEIYFNWTCNALLGLNPVGADNYLKKNIVVIKKAAQFLLNKIGYTPKEIYRGIILQYKLKNGELPPHENFTYLSFSEDKKIARSFADPSPEGFGSVYDLGENGYIISYTPRIDEIIFHYKFAEILPFAKAIEQGGITGSADTIEEQKEVTILQPSSPFKNINYIFEPL